MSYCRFENTYHDLLDCYEALQDKPLDELSVAEKEYAKKLIFLCMDVAWDFERTVDNHRITIHA